MRKEYKKILDEMVANKDIINGTTDGRKLLLYLQIHDVLSYQDTEELYNMGPTGSIQHLMKIILKSRKDEDLIRFCDSLEEAKYDDAYRWLKEKLDNPNSGKLDNPNSGKLDNLDSKKLDNPDLTLLRKSDKTDIKLKIACKNLKKHYEDDLEIVENNLTQFGVKGNLNMENYYNHSIVISNESEKYKQIKYRIENFNNLFSTGYKRIIVMAEAGYGKSTFVHEMARQWVKGNKDWTRKFEFLFLFRLIEVTENESKSLENLLTLCLYQHDASIVHDWLKRGNMSETLFIFDGLDELRQNLCQEIKEVIFGGKVNLATVVITSRQCDKLAEIKKGTHRKFYIELKGYSNEGVIQQLKKFSIPVDKIKQDLKNHLKVPLFNTIFCITHPKSSLVCTNICSSIHSFVNSAINRYRNSNQSFTVSCEEELLITLGQAAQNKFLFIQNVEVPYPNVSSDHLFWAVNSGLLHNTSLIEDLVFAHQSIAEYCAAYFWCKAKRLAIEKCDFSTVKLTEPPNGRLNITEPFPQFLCLLCPEFKEDLWQKFGSHIPIFDEYDNLTVIPYRGTLLQFSSHSVDDQFTIMNKLRFQPNKELVLINGQFEPEKLFITIRKLERLCLVCCTFNTGAEEFFIHFTNVQSLRFQDCEFYYLNIVYDDPDEYNPQCPPHLSLQELKIRNCSVGIETFLSFVMKHSAVMKSFELHTRSFHNLWRKDVSTAELKHSKYVSIEKDVDDCEIGWISELKNNKCLCISIETCELCFAYPFALIPIIETLKKIRHLKKLNLRVLHKLKNMEANALADLLEIASSGLKNINLNIQMENQEDYEPILKNLSKLSALTSLHLWNEPFTTDTLNYLTDIFNNLNLEQCQLDYQEIFFEERIINSINSCPPSKNITFWTKKMKDSNSQLFKKRIENKDRQLRIIESFSSSMRFGTDFHPANFQHYVKIREEFLCFVATLNKINK